MTKKIEDNEKNYDASVAEIERIINELQNNSEKNFEESLLCIEKALSLLHHCKERLHASEQRFEALFADENDM